MFESIKKFSFWNCRKQSRQNSPQVELSNFPQEIWWQILSYLRAEDLQSVALSCCFLYHMTHGLERRYPSLLYNRDQVESDTLHFDTNVNSVIALTSYKLAVATGKLVTIVTHSRQTISLFGHTAEILKLIKLSQRLFCSIDRSGELRIWNPNTLEFIKKDIIFKPKNEILIDMVANDRFIIVATNKRFYIVQYQNENNNNNHARLDYIDLPSSTKIMSGCFAITKKNKVIAVCEDVAYNKRTLVYDLDDNHKLKTGTVAGEVENICLTENEKIFALLRNGDILIFNTSDLSDFKRISLSETSTSLEKTHVIKTSQRKIICSPQNQIALIAYKDCFDQSDKLNSSLTQLLFLNEIDETYKVNHAIEAVGRISYQFLPDGNLLTSNSRCVSIMHFTELPVVKNSQEGNESKVECAM